MSRVGYVNISLEIFGALLSLLIILFLVFSERKKSEQDKLFIRILILNTLVLVSDAAAWIFKGRPDLISGYTVRAANFLVYTFGYLLMIAFSDYFVSFIHTKNSKVSWAGARAIRIIALLAVAMVIISQFNHMYYFIDAQNIYRRQPLFWVSQLFGIVGMVINGATLLKYRRDMEKKELYVFAFYIIMPLVAITIQIFVYGIAMLYIASNIVVICIYIFIQAEQARQYSEKELELERSRVAIMLSQIQPHFIFNTLGTISYLCDHDGQTAQKAIRVFSDFLRTNIDILNHSEQIPFQRELAHVENYLWIEKLRFGEKLTIAYDVQTDHFFLPPLTLQPLVENAVRYGVTKKEEGGTVKISTRESETHTFILVEDNGVGFEVGKPKNDGRIHIGMSNVESRVALQAGGTVEFASQKGVGTRVTICLPKPQ